MQFFLKIIIQTIVVAFDCENTTFHTFNLDLHYVVRSEWLRGSSSAIE